MLYRVEKKVVSIMVEFDVTKWFSTEVEIEWDDKIFIHSLDYLHIPFWCHLCWKTSHVKDHYLYLMSGNCIMNLWLILVRICLSFRTSIYFHGLSFSGEFLSTIARQAIFWFCHSLWRCYEGWVELLSLIWKNYIGRIPYCGGCGKYLWCSEWGFCFSP